MDVRYQIIDPRRTKNGIQNPTPQTKPTLNF